MLAQANLIRGGLILVFAAHHCVVDETGIFDVMKLWSTFCHGGNGTEIIKPEWTDRTPLMQGEGSGRLQDYLEYTLLPAEKSATFGTESTEYISKSSDTTSSAIFFFSDASLRKLKGAATAKEDDGA
jgi:trichothecene 3-O-acetyltransferase